MRADGHLLAYQLSGTSAQIEASGQTTNIPIYHTSATQNGFLVPSNTSGGSTIRDTSNGQSATLAIVGGL